MEINNTLFQEFRKALSDYLETDKKCHNYFSQFLTIMENGVITRRATKNLNQEEFDILNKMHEEVEIKRNNLRELEMKLNN